MISLVMVISIIAINMLFDGHGNLILLCRNSRIFEVIRFTTYILGIEWKWQILMQCLIRHLKIKMLNVVTD